MPALPVPTTQSSHAWASALCVFLAQNPAPLKMLTFLAMNRFGFRISQNDRWNHDYKDPLKTPTHS